VLKANTDHATPLPLQGTHTVKFGTLNSQIGSHFDNLGGLLKAARDSGVVKYSGFLLIPGLSDSVHVELLKYDWEDGTADTYTLEQLKLMTESIPVVTGVNTDTQDEVTVDVEVTTPHPDPRRSPAPE
jgi:hypothetical protein